MTIMDLGEAKLRRNGLNSLKNGETFSQHCILCIETLNIAACLNCGGVCAYIYFFNINIRFICTFYSSLSIPQPYMAHLD